MQGREHTFYTGLAVCDSANGACQATCETYRVALRPLSEEQIRRYVARDNPVDCAGSFKIEGLGIALMEKLAGDDYTALIGLPLIRLVEMLGHFDVDVLQAAP
jgi:septum formation protein